MQTVKNLLAVLLDYYRSEPVRVNAQIVNLAVLVAAYFDFVIEPENVWQALAIVGTITGFAEIGRRKVTPTATLPQKT